MGFHIPKAMEKAQVSPCTKNPQFCTLFHAEGMDEMLVVGDGDPSKPPPPLPIVVETGENIPTTSKKPSHCQSQTTAHRETLVQIPLHTTHATAFPSEMRPKSLVPALTYDPEVVPPPPPHIEDKLFTNHIPTAAEIGDIKQYVSRINEKLSDYDSQIANLEATLLDLQKKRNDLQQVGQAHEALISPVRRLPTEILQTIFEWCLPTNRNAVMHASEAPVLLGRVCAEWRRISLSTPQLWASLHIVPPNVNFAKPVSSTSRFQRKRELIEMWLSRSGDCPLNISFVWFASDSDDEVKLCGSLLEVLVPMCRRWKVLDFQAPLKMFKPFMGLTVEDVPLLEGLSLMDNRTSVDPEAIDGWPESLLFAESSPRLRTFNLTFFSGGIRLPSILWSQLTTLYLESNIAFFFFDSREMLSVLEQCSSLIGCTLKFPLSHTATLPPYEKLDMLVTVPKLETLCLDGDQHLHNTFHMCNTLMNLRTPRLRRLEILGRSGRPEGSIAPEPLSAIRQLLQKSRCPLETLNVESMAILPDEFIACLRLVPTLVELVVHNWAVKMQSLPLDDEHHQATAAPAGPDPQDGPDAPENVILKALTVSSKLVNEVPEDTPEAIVTVAEKLALSDAESPSLFSDSLQDSPTASTSTLAPDDGPLCPRLERFDFMLCDASQDLLCDFVASRWTSSSEGVSRVKFVKCNFTSFEEEGPKKRLQQFRQEGLDTFVTYQVSMNEELNPSPWMGLDTAP
ncbi:hypothetical protein NLJ89_g6474 [Agrocybe chaxingu]|uniref:F-box domain-containing protein n=1 Tax=Agrocybe chaxingu TaxID=84603 RepID=A0A9W8JZ61_9AGAR|nr:hypothetical protein NLJ89_g6474 [Agrocybe chaxingu]